MIRGSDMPASGALGCLPVTSQKAVVLGACIIMAFLIRFSLFLLEPLITPDGLGYIEIGINLISGNGLVDWEGGYLGKLQPLYPFFVGLANLFVGEPAISGALVSMILGSLLIWPVFRFCEMAYDTKTAYTASAIVVVYPYLVNYASSVLTEATYTFFLFSAASWGWLAYRRGRTSDYAICGFLTGLGYLTRFEIAAYLLLFLVFVLVASRGRRWKEISILTAIFFAMVTPYHVYNWLQTGSFMLFAHFENGLRYMVRILDLGDVGSSYSSFFGDPARYAKHYIKGVNVVYTEYLPTLFPPFLIAVTAAGLAEGFRRRALGVTELYFFVIIAITIIGYPILRPSGRNLTVALPFLVVLLAKGINEISPVIAAHLSTTRLRATATGIVVAITAIVCVSVLPQTYRPLLIGPDPVAPVEFMEMGQWMKANLPEVKTIITPDRRVSFYAGINGLPAGLRSAGYRYEEIVAGAHKIGVRYVVVTAYGPSKVQWYKLQEQIREGGKLRLVHSISRRPGMTVQLYNLIN